MWIDAGYSVIDTAILFNNGTYYRFSKDESPQTADYPCGKHVFAEKSTTLISKEGTSAVLLPSISPIASVGFVRIIFLVLL